ncbi:MAG: DEAD/DEAH box helicase [Bacteriovoracaceae bacterium]|nr:DEAD/DEAH box helicase [Bacteriovoracaceae bacterium]
MKLLQLLNCSNSFTLLLAPPGWGKTQMVLELYQSSIKKIIFVSPLRALANEFYKNAKKHKHVLIINKFAQRKEVLKQFLTKPSALLVTTPEMLDESFLIEVGGLENKPLAIFDEFHLFYYWGLTFRPILWETCMGFANSGTSMLGTTATMKETLLKHWEADFSLGVESRFLINIDNQKLLHHPTTIFLFSLWGWPGKKAFNRRFLCELSQNTDEVYLYFCRYRSEVDRWINLCRRKNIAAIGCKGGEVETFTKELETNPSPRCIFATSALGHGVNLPSSGKIFLSYNVENIDFWIQMVGRGGRNGEKFEIFTFNNYLKMNFLSKLLTWIKIIIMDMWIKITNYF